MNLSLKPTKKRSAVSPVIATLLLIAIAVAAAIIVYAFVTGLIGGLTGGSSGLVVESGTLSIPTGVATDNSASLGSLVLTIKNSGSAPIATVSVTENTNTAICDPTAGTDGFGTNAATCTADKWTYSALTTINTWAPTAGLPIPTGQTLSFSTPITGFTNPATAGTTYSYTVTVTFSASTSNNIQTLSLVAQT